MCATHHLAPLFDCPLRTRHPRDLVVGGREPSFYRILDSLVEDGCDVHGLSKTMARVTRALESTDYITSIR
eukprot:CCRYP_008576-RL/>CCRYP_008576-RL protein AED:0.48 eAED:1.00 QI:0/0/0/1/0/0/3/0/70